MFRRSTLSVFSAGLLILSIGCTNSAQLDLSAGRALETIFQRWPEVTENNVAHVFGEHTTQHFGNYSVPYIAPQRVQAEPLRA